MAIEITPAIRAELERAQAELRRAGAAVRWVRPEHIHLTLKFLGATDEERIHEVTEVIRAAVEGAVSFPFEVRGIGAFPEPERPRIIFAGVCAPEAATQIHERLDRDLRPLGVRSEHRPFHPHLTVGRVKDARWTSGLGRCFEEMKDREFGRMEVTGVVFMSSDLTPDGPIYRILTRMPLV